MKRLFYVFIAVSIVSCSSAPEATKVSGEALGTTYHITYFSQQDFPVKQGLDSLFEAINQSMSTYRSSSDISRINQGDSTIVVDTMFKEVFSMSRKVYTESQGYFDPTVGDLVNLYGFGPEEGLERIDSASVDSLMDYVGLDKVQITEEGRVAKEFQEIYLDFNAIAKGYAVDVIGHYLEQQGVENYLAELGGELLAKGKNLEKDSFWTVGIDDPQQTSQTRTLKIILELRDRGMATSGNYRKFRVDPQTGTKFVHTVNPLTGYPEKSNLLSATVLAENCALADAYATAFMALGLERSQELYPQLENVDVYFIYALPDGSIKEYFSPGFEEVVVETLQ